MAHEDLKPVMYRLTKRNPKPALRGRHYPMNKRLPSEEVIYDPERKTTRTIRYAIGESSVYKDEQPQNVTLGDIVFQNGSVLVDGMNPLLIQFLELSNHNQDNPFRIKTATVLFSKLDPEKDADKAMSAEIESIQAANIVISMDFDELKALARTMGVDVNRSVKEVKHDMLVKAKQNPKGFLDEVDNPKTQRKSTILDAMDLGIIDVTARAIHWKVGNGKGGLITPIPVGMKPLDYLAEWSMTDEEGDKVYSEIKKKVEKAS